MKKIMTVIIMLLLIILVAVCLLVFGKKDKEGMERTETAATDMKTANNYEGVLYEKKNHSNYHIHTYNSNASMSLLIWNKGKKNSK